MSNRAADFRILMFSTAGIAAILASPAMAQSADAAPPSEVASGSLEAAVPSEAAEGEILVTGSRIRRAATDTPSPVVVVDQQSLIDRGFVSAAQALNNATANIPALNQAPGNGNSAGSGQQFPNLFGLGSGRTLTLLNGRRMVTTSSGLGDAQVDANIIPVGLLERVEVVQAGGAVVYGSDAIAGVVNYILKKNFTGIEIDGQAGAATEGRYGTYSARLTAGTNFADGRGNVALNVEYSQSPKLRFADRRLTNLSRVTQSNSADTGPSDGIPSVREVLDGRLFGLNSNGVIFNTPAPPPNFLTRLNGSPLQFAPDGSVIPYDPGTILGVPFATGGQGFRYTDLAGLRTGVKRFAATAIGHYDLTDGITLSGEFLFARTIGDEVPQATTQSVLGTAAAGNNAIAFTRNNAFLTPGAIATLSAASANFAAGGPLFLSKSFTDLLTSSSVRNVTDTYRGALSLDGEFKAFGGRDFYWSAALSYAQVEGSNQGYGLVRTRYANALNAVFNGGGQVVCAINADANPANDDPACSPINPFGNGNVSAAARAYVSAPTGQDYTNKQVDALLTLGGDLAKLPGGMLKFSMAYEHRDESASFKPVEASRLGLTGTGVPVQPQSGRYNTDELSAELLVPLVGGDFTLPLVRSLELNGAFRHVNNSVAGKENLWSLGLRWEPVEGLTLRASRSRNFRAPTLTQLVAPISTSPAPIQSDPCDADRINSGPNPAQRRASCLALFEANPNYGTGGATAPPGLTAAQRLAAFQDPAENSAIALIASGGNPSLRNEISKTWTYGFVFQPKFIPGLTVVVDRIEVDIERGLSPFTTQNFAEACTDDANPNPAVCSAFSRLAVGDGVNPAGTIIAGRTTTFNAGITRFRGEVFNVNYQFGLDSLFGGSNLGRVEVGLEATHTSLYETSVTGAAFTRIDNTAAQPDWVGKFNFRYIKGPFRLSYQLNYLDGVLRQSDSTIENDPNPRLARNITHDISAQYDLGLMTVRMGLTNFTNEEPSYPSFSYGDIIGRQFYVGARLKF